MMILRICFNINPVSWGRGRVTKKPWVNYWNWVMGTIMVQLNNLFFWIYLKLSIISVLKSIQHKTEHTMVGPVLSGSSPVLFLRHLSILSLSLLMPVKFFNLSLCMFSVYFPHSKYICFAFSFQGKRHRLFWHLE